MDLDWGLFWGLFQQRQGGDHNQGGHAGPPLPKMVQWFKTMTTNAYIRAINTHGWPPLPGRLWQRNYYERVIRNDDELHRARKYIVDNPTKWGLDPENPTNAPPHDRPGDVRDKPDS